eukprot:4889161-Pyramimonas_sp.AAC.1
MMDRACIDFPFDPNEQRALACAASAIQSVGTGPASPDLAPYSTSEVDSVLDSLKSTSSALRGCFASARSA